MERKPLRPPKIEPIVVPDRPFLSVMIPVYNCADFLVHALHSVLAQDMGPEVMEIVVVDDASTDADVKRLVDEIGGGRVGYYGQTENVGSLRNFETAINLSRGYHIHLLHGDDVVKPGFYQEVVRLFTRYPSAGMVFTQNTYINEYGVEIGMKGPVMNEEGIIPGWFDRISVCNHLEASAAVVKREVYENLGSFYGVHYGEDWEMWARIGKHYPVAYLPVALVQYRKSSRNISFNAHRTTQSVDDILAVIDFIAELVEPARRKETNRKSRMKFSQYFSWIASVQKYRNPKSSLALAFKSFRLHRNSYTFYVLSRIVVQYFFGRLKRNIIGAKAFSAIDQTKASSSKAA